MAAIISDQNDFSNSESLCVAPMPPIKFGLNLHLGLGGDVT